MIGGLLRKSDLGRKALEAVARARVTAAAGGAKIHLGCGEQILDGYVNVDFPPSEHTLQRRSRADFYADIRRLEFPAGSFAEVRLHHVFEHFDRPTALALLVRWQRWLSPGGQLRVETPDFDGCARVVLDPAAPQRDKAVCLRHLFGSHEASWAYHLEGWNEQRFRHTLGRLGYHVAAIEHGQYKGIANVTATAARGTVPAAADQRARVAELLAESLVDDSPSEKDLLAIWLRAYDELIGTAP